MKTDFILVNWNTRDLLVSALEALDPLRMSVSAEVIVIDNDSSDGSAEVVRARFPEVTLLRNGRNEGFAFAVNQGIARSRAPILCLLNPDLLIEAASLCESLRVLEEHPEAGALAPLLLDGHGEVWAYPDRFPGLTDLIAREVSPWRRPDQLSRGRLVAGSKERGSAGDSSVENGLVGVDWVAGACLFLRRTALEAIGGMDERFFLYKEDVDLCLRLRQAGWDVLRLDRVQLGHLIARSTRENRGLDAGRSQVEGFRSSVLYARKHMGDAAALSLALVLRAALLARMAKSLVRTLLPGGDAARVKLRWMNRAFTELDRPVGRTGSATDATRDARRAA